MSQQHDAAQPLEWGHVSPTLMVNGLVQADLGSGDDISVRAERLLA